MFVAHYTSSVADERGVRGKAGFVFQPPFPLSLSLRAGCTATPGVQKCPICPFPTQPYQLGFPPSRVSCVAHYQRRTKGDPTSTLDEYSPRGRLKIRVLYYRLATFVQARSCTAYVRRIRTCAAAIGKRRSVAFNAGTRRKKVNAGHQGWLNVSRKNECAPAILGYIRRRGGAR